MTQRMESKDLVINPGPNDTQPIDPVQIPTEYPALFGRVWLRRGFGKNTITPGRILIGFTVLKITVFVAEFGDLQAGWVLNAILFGYVILSLAHLFLAHLRIHRGETVPDDDPGTPLLLPITLLVRRYWQNPPWFAQKFLDRPTWATALILEPLVWVIVALLAYRIPGESDGAKVAGTLAAVMFFHAYSKEIWSEEQAPSLSEQQAPATPSTFAAGVALFERLTKVATAPKRRQEQDSADDHTPAAV